MSLSHALAEVSQLQMKVMKLQSQVADQEVRIKRKEAQMPVQEVVQAPMDLEKVNAQLDSQLRTLFVLRQGVQNLDSVVYDAKKKGEQAFVISLCSFLLMCYMLFFAAKAMQTV